MADLKIKLELKPKRCEICHQTDMFEQESEICLRCIKIQETLSESSSNNNFIGNNKPKLLPSNIEPMYFFFIALIVTLTAHVPLMCLITVYPPYYSGTVFFCVEIFIACFAFRWKKEIAQGIFLALVSSSIIVIILLKLHPFNVLISRFVGKN